MPDAPFADRDALLAEAKRRGLRLPPDRLDQIAAAVGDLERFARTVREVCAREGETP